MLLFVILIKVKTSFRDNKGQVNVSKKQIDSSHNTCNDMCLV